jgi:hypothetical protein
MDGRPEPVIGWRLWKVKDGALQSWAVNHTWRAGENRAVCLSDEPYRCPHSPGDSCRCGFWALYSPLAAIQLASSASPARTVMGLIAGLGIVAVHGPEGFRAEKAVIMCLFSDVVASSPMERVWRRIWRRIWRRLRKGAADRTSESWRRRRHGLTSIAEPMRFHSSRSSRPRDWDSSVSSGSAAARLANCSTGLIRRRHGVVAVVWRSPDLRMTHAQCVG